MPHKHGRDNESEEGNPPDHVSSLEVRERALSRRRWRWQLVGTSFRTTGEEPQIPETVAPQAQAAKAVVQEYWHAAGFCAHK